MELDRSHTETKRRQHCQTSATVDVTRPQRKRTTEKILRDLDREMWTVGFRLAGGRWRQQHKTELGGDE